MPETVEGVSSLLIPLGASSDFLSLGLEMVRRVITNLYQRSFKRSAFQLVNLRTREDWLNKLPQIFKISGLRSHKRTKQLLELI